MAAAEQPTIRKRVNRAAARGEEALLEGAGQQAWWSWWGMGRGHELPFQMLCRCNQQALGRLNLHPQAGYSSIRLQPFICNSLIGLARYVAVPTSQLKGMRTQSTTL